ncbi:MAG: hypothetical protein RLZZ338_2927 [Cyanobacteriota bacterium]|jgi:ketosteroid isomerase-like protein
MAPNVTVMQAVEQLNYRVTVGDVAVKAGLDVNIAQRELLNLASEAGGHLQVAESGDIAYLFPKNFRDILRDKFLRLQLQEWWGKIWRILFYLIRISFGLVLIASLMIIFVSIYLLIIAINSSNNSNSGGEKSGFNLWFFPTYWWNDIFWLFYWNDDPYYREKRQKTSPESRREMNFFEAVFSFLFGDGNPNFDLEERRWKSIAKVIRNNQGAVTSEQIAPYLDNLGKGYALEYEEYMLPVLAKFDGRPEVSPQGQIIYHFSELQTTAKKNKSHEISPYLRESLWGFSEANSGQILLATGLGMINFVGALVLGNLFTKAATIGKINGLGGFLGFVQGIYPILLIYGIGFLTIPLIRYFWIQWRNSKIEAKNIERQLRAEVLDKPDALLEQKLNYARKFTAEKVIEEGDLAYTSEKDLIEQEIEQTAKIDAEWERKLNQSSRSNLDI